MDALTQSLISGGVATVFVTDMDRAARFYCDQLGLRLVFRAGNHWAQIHAGQGFMIGLHPSTGGGSNPPGVNGGVQIGLNVTRPIEEVVADLQSRGVSFAGELVNDEQGGIKLAFLADPDGNQLYLCESKRP